MATYRSCFVVGDTYMNVIWLYIVDFNDHDVLRYWGEDFLLKPCPIYLKTAWIQKIA